MSLDVLYPPLLDAYVTEWASGFASRAEVREAVEKALDEAQPMQRRQQTWGIHMSRDQLALLQSRSKAGRRSKPAAAQEAVDEGWRPTPRDAHGNPIGDRR
jgi:hypothetical protein